MFSVAANMKVWNASEIIGLVVRVPGYRFRGLGFYSWYCQII
jgi:hypothetical protein